MTLQRGGKYVLDQRRFTRPRYTRHAHQPLQWNLDRDIAQIVFGCAFEHEPRRLCIDRAALPVRRMRHMLAAAEVRARQRVAMLDFVRRPVIDNLTAALSRY